MIRTLRTTLQVPTGTHAVMDPAGLPATVRSSVKWCYGARLIWSQDIAWMAGTTPCLVHINEPRPAAPSPFPSLNLAGFSLWPGVPVEIQINDSSIPRIDVWENAGSDGTLYIEIDWDDGRENDYHGRRTP